MYSDANAVSLPVQISGMKLEKKNLFSHQISGMISPLGIERKNNIYFSVSVFPVLVSDVQLK